MHGLWMAEPQHTSQPTEVILQNTTPSHPGWFMESTCMQWAWGRSICKSRHITDIDQEPTPAWSHYTKHYMCPTCHTMGHRLLGYSANGLLTLCKRATGLPLSLRQNHQLLILENSTLYWTTMQIETCTPCTPRSGMTPINQKSPWQQL